MMAGFKAVMLGHEVGICIGEGRAKAPEAQVSGGCRVTIFLLEQLTGLTSAALFEPLIVWPSVLVVSLHSNQHAMTSVLWLQVVSMMIHFLCLDCTSHPFLPGPSTDSEFTSMIPRCWSLYF